MNLLGTFWTGRARCTVGTRSIPAGASLGQILKACRRAMGSQARLLIVDLVLPERVEADPRITGDMMFDLIMMSAIGGRERSAGALEALLGTSGLRVERVIPMPIPDKMVVAVPT
jgi:O-methyltransferase domain